MKAVFLILIIAGGLYYFLKPDLLPELLESGEYAQVNDQSGIQDRGTVGGAGFDINELSSYGQVTVVDFYVSWCSACKRLSSDYKKFLKARPDVAIRRVKMKDKWNEQWAMQKYGLDIKTTPHVLIFDAEGRLIVQDAGGDKSGLKLLYKWMSEEVVRANKV